VYFNRSLKRIEFGFRSRYYYRVPLSIKGYWPIHMDDLVHHCLRELSFDGDLGKYSYHVMSRGLAGCAMCS